MNSIDINICVTSCDERIASIQDKLLSWKVYGAVLKITNLDFDVKYIDKLKCYENNIALVKTEKLIYNALINTKSPKEIFPKLLSKYDDLMGLSYDISGNMVLTGMNAEGDHLEYCSLSLHQREFIKRLCIYGEKR